MKKLITLASLATASLQVQATPLFNIFELGVQSQATAKYDAVAQNNISTSIAQEKGTLAMYSLKDANNPNLAYMVEVYADQEAYQVHAQSPQYKNFLENSPQILTDHKVRIALEPQFMADKKVEATAPVTTKLVKVTVKPEFNQAFAEIVVGEMQEAIKVEEGVLAMYAAKTKEQDNVWYFFEIYADEQAYEYHRQTPHYKYYIEQTQHMVEDKYFYNLTPSYLGNQGGLTWLRNDVLKF
ncbi:antibiotic biosynthesis monooxygenase [Psittacicella hinzii]|uniref:Antibiotic biosynthesis monooxygenase n=1 Tax=Psittacicella hinzii TaxID=2028575 RepID=A0A3A1Y437_9GAMM|nr:antibiotic biosynthesis monooxygenase [Psittacicella hinzii]